jgi:hypothetical protein
MKNYEDPKKHTLLGNVETSAAKTELEPYELYRDKTTITAEKALPKQTKKDHLPSTHIVGVAAKGKGRGD